MNSSSDHPARGFLAWADRRHFISVRALSLYVTLWMTWDSYTWAAGFAEMTKLDAVGAAAVIAAVTIPVSALQAFVFKWYMDAKGGNP